MGGSKRQAFEKKRFSIFPAGPSRIFSKKFGTQLNLRRSLLDEWVVRARQFTLPYPIPENEWRVQNLSKIVVSNAVHSP
jgi:hypothetical protein